MAVETVRFYEKQGLVNGAASSACEISVLDMREKLGANRARELGVRFVPVVAIDGRTASHCAGRGVDIEMLRAAGLGQSE